MSSLENVYKNFSQTLIPKDKKNGYLKFNLIAFLSDFELFYKKL